MKIKKIVAISILVLIVLIPVALFIINKSKNKDANINTEPEKQIAENVNEEDLKALDNVADTNESADVVSKGNESKGELLEIKEKLFISQINDIFYNIDQYKDKTVRVEGMYDFFEIPDEEKPIQMVYRNGPGCCGNDGWAGFLLKFEGEKPKPNDWIVVEGKPELDQTEDFQDLYLVVKKLEIKDKRGAEFVAH